MATVTAVNSRTPIGSTRAMAYKDLRELFGTMVDSLQGTIRRNTTGSTISKVQADSIKAESHKMVMAQFVGPDGRHPYRDTYTPLAPYPTLMNKWIGTVTGRIVANCTSWMIKNVPSDIIQELHTRNSKKSLVSEYTEEERKAFIKKQTDLRIFNPNPLANYEPAHTWVDPNGYQLSDRIWQTAMRTDAKIDAMLTDNIRNGMSSTDLAKAVEKYLLPGRLGYRTDKPYGRDASYDAMRLARTEINHAGNQATLASAISNPYVDKMDWALSKSHPKEQYNDSCDKLCTIDENGNQVREPYPVINARIPPGHPHCLCSARQTVTKTPTDVTDQLRSALQESKALLIDPYLTPVQYQAYLVNLLGYDPGLPLPHDVAGITFSQPVNMPMVVPKVEPLPVKAVSEMTITEILASHENELATIRNKLIDLELERDAKHGQYQQVLNERIDVYKEIRSDTSLLAKLPEDTEKQIAYKAKFRSQLEAKQNKHEELTKRLEELSNLTYDKKVRSTLSGDTPDLKVKFGGKYKGFNRSKGNAATEFLSTIMNGDSFDPLKAQVVFIQGRAFHTDGEVHLDKNNSVSTWIHEMGHEIEAKDKVIFNRSVEFLEKRAEDNTPGKSIKSMNHLYGYDESTGSYRPDEIGYRDAFDQPYVGKIYKNAKTGQYYGTEIVSMGLETLYSDPVRFAKIDPEYFNYMIATIRGWTK